ncbi:MAG: serine protease [Akkermansiaceae bacterium]|nr:serine protease [Akkermansiaceae bacterium]
MMKRLLVFNLFVLLPCSAFAEGGRSYINDKKAPENRKDLESIEKALKNVLPKVRAATVGIEIKDGSGSGVIISEDGLILTAAHVATGVRKKVTVILEDGTKLKAETLGLVADHDAAMVQILDKGSYPFVEMDRDASTRLGDWVFALGHSGGFDKERGLVARLGRLVRVANATFQSDCTLIGGDSGGPLFDLAGKLIAIHSRVGKNLPENMHVPMAEYIEHWDGMKKGEFIGEGPFAQKPEKGRGILGIATENLEGGGLRITGVGEETPAAGAGILKGDKLLKMNDSLLKNRQEMQDLLKEMAAGDEAILEIERDGKPKTFTLQLGER